MIEKEPNISPAMLDDAKAHEHYHRKRTDGEATMDTSKEFENQRAAELQELAEEHTVPAEAPNSKDKVKQEEMKKISKILNRMKKLDAEGVKPTLQEGQELQLNTSPKK